jgi:hypothetical protein
MLRILGRGRSVPTVTELIFVRAQCFYQCAIKAFCTLRTCNWICESAVLLPVCYKSILHFADLQLDPVASPQSAKCFYSTLVKALRSHTFFLSSLLRITLWVYING